MKKQTAVISFFTVICFLFVTWVPCHAADASLYVCKNNKTGAPRLVKSPTLCKAKTEYLVTLTAGSQGSTGPQGPTGSTGPQGAQGSAGPSSGAKVYDAADQFLGYYITSSGGDNPLIEVMIEPLKKHAHIEDFSGELALDSVYFQSTDCTGTPYTHNENKYRVFRGHTGKYYTGTYMQPVSFFYNSLYYYNSCLQIDPNQRPGYVTESSSVVAIEVTLPFTTPVALPMRLE
jgi:hypothetical protein